MGFDASALFLVLITIVAPPVGVFMVSGCGPDLAINCLLCLLAYIPGHLHAFWLEWKYYERKEGRGQAGPIKGVYSDRINNPGAQSYGYQAVNSAPPPNYGSSAGNQQYAGQQVVN
ncbi:hypothetical protein HKX48_009371 [Thoreauomyces humboldtii]|nr:hypothetical protein HKX48_009371 [Thoreauomyces humboldtii]